MKAKEMFEKLGYEIDIDSAHISYLFKNKEYIRYKKIDFHLVGEGLSVEGMSLSKADMQAIFMQCLELGWVEQVPKYKTNLDHYRDKILEDCTWNLALVKGKPEKCSDISCRNCDFYNEDDAERHCYELVRKWLKQPYKEPANKLTKFEYDLLQSIKHDYKFKKVYLLRELKEKGHFQNVNDDDFIKDLLANYEIVEEKED